MSVGSWSADSISKAHRVHGTRWIALVAGGDVGYAPGVLTEVRERLVDTRGTAREVRQAFGDVCAAEIERKIRLILIRYGVTMERLQAGPSASLHSRFYEEVMDAIRRKELECSFLVCGFGPEHSDEAVVFEVLTSGKIRQFQDVVGFWAIGSGSEHAIEAFTHHQDGPRTKFPVAVYCACEAKFRAEKNQGVGRKTWLFLIDQAGVHVQVGETNLTADIRSACDTEAAMSQDLIKRISGVSPRRFNEYE